MLDEEQKLKAQLQVSRGEKAKAIVEDPLVGEAFDVIEKTIYDAWKNTTFDQVTHREEAVRMGRVAGLLREQFYRIIRDGENARVMLNEEDLENAY